MDTSNTHSTIAGLAYAAILSNVPDAWLSYGEKLLYGIVLAFVTAVAHKAGVAVWDRFKPKSKEPK